MPATGVRLPLGVLSAPTAARSPSGVWRQFFVRRSSPAVVVADELRDSAQRATQAAPEATSLIAGSIEKTQWKMCVAGAVAQTPGTIVGDIARVSNCVQGISSASDEQAQGVEQVNTAVADMDQATQRNAAGIEESASASEELASQASSVKTDDGHRTRRRD